VAALIAARNIAAGYRGPRVIHDVNISVDEGEIVAILGANGAGKSTTLRALVGEIELMSGQVEWLGQPTAKPLHARVREGLGYIPEDRSVFPGLTVEGNLRVGRGSVEQAVSHFPELEPHLGRRAGALSGGQQQMVTLGRVLAANPRALVVDELSQGLAPVLVRRLFRALVQASQRGVGILVVEQHAQLIMEVAARVMVMKRGAVVAAGTTSELAADMGALKAMYLGSATASDARPRPDDGGGGERYPGSANSEPDSY
jgi:branched-chain amino acid transport system ATP-binding protein